MITGIIAGSISAIVAALVSLPLRSPDDILLNSATVAVGATIAGVAAGILWRLLANRGNRPLMFTMLWAMGLALTALVAVAGETQLDHFLAFVLPLAAIVFPLTGALTAVLADTVIVSRWWLAPAAVVIALAVGISLSGQGDQESGRLELPPRAGISTPFPMGDIVAIVNPG